MRGPHRMIGFKMQVLGFNGAGKTGGDLPAAITDDGVAISDKKHCFEPNVQVGG